MSEKNKKIFWYLFIFGFVDILYVFFKFIGGRYGIIDINELFNKINNYKNIKNFIIYDNYYNSGLLLFLLFGVLLILLGIIFLKKAKYAKAASKILVSTLFLLFLLSFVSGFFIMPLIDKELSLYHIIFLLFLLTIGITMYFIVYQFLRKKIPQEEYTKDKKFLKYLFNVIIVFIFFIYFCLFYYGMKNYSPGKKSKNEWNISEYFH